MIPAFAEFLVRHAFWFGWVSALLTLAARHTWGEAATYLAVALSLVVWTWAKVRGQT